MNGSTMACYNLFSNIDSLVQAKLRGFVAAPRLSKRRSTVIDTDGRERLLPGMFGICLNAFVGDSVFKLVGDHVEPGAKITCPDDEEDGALRAFSCVGNHARVLTSHHEGARGAQGRVIGKHCGLIVHFRPDDIGLLSMGDEIEIVAHGAGLECFPQWNAAVFNMGSELARALEDKYSGFLPRFPVSHIVDSGRLGSGMFSTNPYIDDIDLQVTEQDCLDTPLSDLRLGDLVALKGCECSHGIQHHPEGMVIAVVIHGSSVVPGHGPGMLPLLSLVRSPLVPEISKDANIAHILEL